MPTAFLEIVELDNGEIVLKRADDDAEPLARIRFSEESSLFMMDNGLEVAKVMFQAGIQAAASMAEQADTEGDTPWDESSPIIH